MTNLLPPDGLAGCFRCAYLWRPRSKDPDRCPRCKSRLWDVPKLQRIPQGHRLGIREILHPHRQEIFRLVLENKASNPRVFGSVARREAGRTSDVDLLVDFAPDASLFDQFALKEQLEKLLRRSVDVVDPASLHWLVRPQVMFEATSL